MTKRTVKRQQLEQQPVRTADKSIDLSRMVNLLLDAPLFRRVRAEPHVTGVEYNDQSQVIHKMQLHSRMAHKVIGAAPTCGTTTYLSITGATAATTFTLGTVHAKHDGSVVGLSAEATVNFSAVTIRVYKSVDDGATFAELDSKCSLYLDSVKGGEALFDQDRFKFKQGDLLVVRATQAGYGGSTGNMAAEIDVEYDVP